MNIVESLRDKDDIQAMKDYLSSWNEKYYMGKIIKRKQSRKLSRR